MKYISCRGNITTMHARFRGPYGLCDVIIQEEGCELRIMHGMGNGYVQAIRELLELVSPEKILG